MTEPKKLPQGYLRDPIIAWVIAIRKSSRTRTDGKTRRPIIAVDATHLIARYDEYTCAEIDWSGDDDEGEVTVLPASPNTFLIWKEREDGSCEEYCYEINGIIEDPQLAEKVRDLE